MTAPVCRQCSADLTNFKLGRVEGDEGGIHVAIEGLPAVECTNSHKRFPSPEFPLEFIQRTLQSSALDGVIPAAEKGLFRKRLHCPSCGKQLPDEATRNNEGRAQIELPEVDPVTVELAVPLFRCSGCGKEASLAKSSVERGVMQAVANAFRSADIPPG
jgi:hypothetical protein